MDVGAPFTGKRLSRRVFVFLPSSQTEERAPDLEDMVLAYRFDLQLLVFA